MGRQEDAFVTGEGNAWHARNVGKPRHSVVCDAIRAAHIKPNRAIEIGCGDGLNIGEIEYHYGCDAEGVDPSTEAIKHAHENYLDVDFFLGTASKMKVITGQFDLVVYGFCLYVCDRNDLAEIVAGGDGILEDGGHLVIHDFDPNHPHRVKYHHLDGVFSYKMNYAKLWLANPAYSLVSKTTFLDNTAIWILKKDVEAGWSLIERENHET